MKLALAIPGLVALVLGSACQSGQAATDEGDAVRRLESATDALRELGEHEEAERLEAITVRVAREHTEDVQRDEEEHAKRGAADHERNDLLVMRTAVVAFLEIDRHDPADAVEREMHAREMELEGRDDDEARRIRSNRPEPRELVELLAWAGGLWDEWGHETKAANLHQLAERLQEEHAAHARRPDALRSGPDLVENQIEILLLAARGLSVVGDHDAVNRLELSIAARKARLQGREADARHLEQERPSHEEEIELLVRAEDVYRDGDMPDRADLVSAGTERYWGEAADQHGSHAAEVERMSELQQHVHELQTRIHRLQDELQRLDEEERAREEREDGIR